MENQFDESNANQNEQTSAPNYNAPGITYIDTDALNSPQPFGSAYQLEHRRVLDKKRFSVAFIPPVVFFILTFAVYDIVGSLFPFKDPFAITTAELLYVQLFTMLITHLLTIGISALLFKQNPLLPLFDRPLKPNKAFLTVLFALGAGRLAEIVVTPIYQLVPVNIDQSAQFATLQTTLIVFVMYAIIPPIFEEWLLRGMVLRHLLPFGKWTAIIVSASIFALMHNHPGQALFAFTLGIILGIIYINSGGNIWLAFIVHFLNNALSVMQGYIIAHEIEGIYADLILYASTYAPLIVAIIILFILTFKNKRAFFLPREIDKDIITENFDEKPRSAAKIIFTNISTYVYIIFSVLLMFISAANVS